MSIDKRISEFDIIEEFDITTKIPIIQGSPLKNGIITPKDFTKSIGLDNVDNTSDLDKPISTATKNYVDNHTPIITLTEDEYHFLDTKDPNIFYFIKED